MAVFAEDGRSVACTVIGPGGLRCWKFHSWRPTGPTSHTRSAVPSLGPHSQLLPISQGRTLVCHHRGGGQQIDLVTVRRGASSVRRIMTAELAGLSFDRPPTGRERRTGHRTTTDRRNRLVQLEAGLHPGARRQPRGATAVPPSGDQPERRSSAPGCDARHLYRRDLVDGGGRRLGGEVTVDGRPCDGVAIDLTTGAM